MSEMKGLPSIDALEGAHTFPCEYTYKVIGDNAEGFAERAQAIAADVAGGSNVEMSTRQSSKGNHLSVTLNVYAQSAHEVQAIYIELHKLDALRLLL